LPLPEKILVKISSEEAGYLSLSPVVSQQMVLGELIEQILGVTGKDTPRVRDILRQGTLVSGASRFRWAPVEPGLEEITRALGAFPNAEPERPFDAGWCVRAALSGGRAVVELEREAASRRRWLARRSFWQELMETAARLTPRYQHYSYTDHADVYRAALPAESAEALRGRARLLRYASLEAAVREYCYNLLDLWVERPTGGG